MHARVQFLHLAQVLVPVAVFLELWPFVLFSQVMNAFINEVEVTVTTTLEQRKQKLEKKVMEVRSCHNWAGI